uniref:Uncharacterized protein n=1 Tax=Haptolina brevifila TaxID=156173 RepID=A0A7S2IBN3_9EUKA|mmetsp:Transcript_64266/g.126984  ORF Transcript_64266/g.126984 Transcript_64266/m.126984 type:complete len:202 (+) Transcript_64266:19-624(+)
MDALVQAVNFGHVEEVRAALSTQPEAALQAPFGDVASLLHEAATAGHADVCRVLLQAGASKAVLDEDGQTALHHAANEGNVEVVQLLAPSPDCSELFILDNYQMTPYHLACENGHEATVSHLLKLLDEQPTKTEPEATKLRRGSALFLAQKGGHLGIVEMVNSARSTTPSSREEPSSSSCGNSGGGGRGGGGGSGSGIGSL